MYKISSMSDVWWLRGLVHLLAYNWRWSKSRARSPVFRSLHHSIMPFMRGFGGIRVAVHDGRHFWWLVLGVVLHRFGPRTHRARHRTPETSDWLVGLAIDWLIEWLTVWLLYWLTKQETPRYHYANPIARRLDSDVNFISDFVTLSLGAQVHMWHSIIFRHTLSTKYYLNPSSGSK